MDVLLLFLGLLMGSLMARLAIPDHSHYNEALIAARLAYYAPPLQGG